ncbi:MAG: hypothetical protein JW754_02440 [Candidatus Aenigmarchaeota archaeon]|nr:hypothetical protein [Candidatus Aenigmarchaeota archaeon]
MTKATLTDYKNFWLIWINCAGSEKGMSLFSIQNEWKIKTNYLYHNESGLGKPLFKCMIEEGYLTKAGKYLKPRFEWIPGFINEKYRQLDVIEAQGQWKPNGLIREKWNVVQKFIQKYHNVLFDIKKIKLLYNGDKHIVGRNGHNIFSDVFLFVLFSNITSFTRKYKADVVLRIISTLISISSEKNIINYMSKLNSEFKEAKDFPMIVRNENELSRILCSIKWQ